MNTENELFGELHEQEEHGLFGNEHRRQYEAQQETAQGFNLTDEDRLKRSDKLWKKLVKELSVLQDDNFTARQLFDYIERHYCQPPQQPLITVKHWRRRGIEALPPNQ